MKLTGFQTDFEKLQKSQHPRNACLTTLMQTHNNTVLITTYTDENPRFRCCVCWYFLLIFALNIYYTQNARFPTLPLPYPNQTPSQTKLYWRKTFLSHEQTKFWTRSNANSVIIFHFHVASLSRAYFLHSRRTEVEMWRAASKKEANYVNENKTRNSVFHSSLKLDQRQWTWAFIFNVGRSEKVSLCRFLQIQ